MKKSILSASIAAMIGGLGLAGMANAAVGLNVFNDSPAPSVAIGAAVLITDTNQAGAAAAAVAANVANGTAATTLAVNEAGTGHILVVPYFTTQGTNATLLNIVNTDTANGKAVKVRFRGASNSDDIFDFTLLLSPGDVWAAKVSQGADGISKLETGDKTCTLPSAVATQANSFPTGRLNSALSAADKANETREGYIEILNMADVPKAVQTNQSVAAGVTVNPLFTAIKHVSGVAPCTTAALGVLLTPAQDYTHTAVDTGAVSVQGKGMKFPTGQLMANWTIIDTVKTATFSGAAIALKAGTDAAPNANVVFFPQSDTSATTTVATVVPVIDNFTADPLLRTGAIWKGVAATGALTAFGPAAGSTSAIISASYYDLPDLSTPYLAVAAPASGLLGAPVLQARTLSGSLATKTVVNEYLTTTSIAATTDWVFSMPTRRYNVGMNYAYTSPIDGDGRVYTDFAVAVGAAMSANMTGAADANNFFNAANTSVSGYKICTGAAGVNQWDREETTTSSQFVISPGTVTNVRFCGETSVLAFNNGTNTSTGSLSASVAMQNLNVSANEGWVKLGTAGLGAKGLPVTGAAFAKSSSFGAVWAHRYAR
ncbi:MAG: cell surface protein [Burkholderiaceae bacterium]